MDSMDNGGVYKLTDDIAIIQSVDFFTPVVDDPYNFGQIAVVNALSDIYTMGAKPLTAMNIVGFPIGSMDISILQKILQGGASKLVEAGVILLGGHSIDDNELKYGLSVTGVIHPDKLLTNSGACPGDKVVLTKALGTGIISTALKQGKANTETVAKMTKSMLTLNRKASEVMQEVGVHACTDITGFGFVGHTSSLLQNSGFGLNLDLAALPIFPDAIEFAKQGIGPGGLQNNKAFYASRLKAGENVPGYMQDILFDPQTSGGLLMAVAPEKAERLLNRLKLAGVDSSAIIGEIVSGPAGVITVK
jgi:selenide, water dikinase